MLWGELNPYNHLFGTPLIGNVHVPAVIFNVSNIFIPNKNNILTIELLLQFKIFF